MKVLFVHAHFDDFEFTAAGTFAQWRGRWGDSFRGRVLVCTDGKAGHHRLGREETGRVRLAEQEASARVGGYEFQQLRLPDGSVPRETMLRHTPHFLAALWKAIRDFEPDYLLAPPIPTDPRAGVHLDHAAVAEAVREVAYLINVPHAFTPEYPEEAEAEPRFVQTPVILTVFDSYMAGANAADLVVDIDPVFDLVARMSWCHQSQIREWLPWVGRHRLRPPETLEDWKAVLSERMARQQRRLGLPPSPRVEVFQVTSWGETPTFEQLMQDFPALVRDASREARLKAWLQSAGE
ncbi:MAG: PIG-L family deacetylase [Verrucomicrobia bacterium]|nr:MAG: PIG-L family deacetylase [Verrucomicrobiota bacterium]